MFLEQADFCWPVDVNYLINSRGKQQKTPLLCNDNGILERMETLFMVPISMPSHTQGAATLVFMPTRGGFDMCQLDFTIGTGSVRQSGDATCFTTAQDFISSTGMPTVVGGRQGGTIGNFGSDGLQRAAVLRNNVVSRVSRTVSQNTESWIIASASPLLVFIGNDPAVRISWLSQSRIVVVGNQASGTRHTSQIATMQVEVQMACDRYSCLGCPPGRLLTLCYIAQQCTIEKCIGTAVNQKKPLCNVGASLQKAIEVQIAASLGVWITFVESYGTVLDLSFDIGESKRLSIESIDDSFHGQVCAWKDLAGTSSSIFTSMIGAILISKNNAGATVGSNQWDQGGNDVSDRLNAKVVMATNGVNAFLYQLLLGPLFILMGSQKAYVCGGNSIMALTRSNGFSITLGRSDLQAASDQVAGKCLTSYTAACVDNMQEAGSNQCVASVANSILSQGQQLVSSVFNAVYLDPVMHAADAVLSYVGGVISGLQDMAQVLDAEHCRVPDYYIYKSVTCACNDSAVQIQAVNQTQGLNEFAHWCTGTLSMVSSFGRQVFIYNKYSFAELKRIIQAGRVDGEPSRVDNYLKCLSNTNASAYNTNRCASLKPVLPDITIQGASPLAVLQRCKDNYQQGRWDPGAWLLYDKQHTSRIHIIGKPVYKICANLEN